MTEFLGEARLVLVRTGEALQKIETNVEDAQQRKLRAMQMLGRTLEYVEAALAEREGTVAFVSGSADSPRLDAEVLRWFKRTGAGYQSRIGDPHERHGSGHARRTGRAAHPDH